MGLSRSIAHLATRTHLRCRRKPRAHSEVLLSHWHAQNGGIAETPRSTLVVGSVADVRTLGRRSIPYFSSAVLPEFSMSDEVPRAVSCRVCPCLEREGDGLGVVTWAHFESSEKRESDRLFRMVTAANDPHQHDRAMAKLDEWQRGATALRRRHECYLKRIVATG